MNIGSVLFICIGNICRSPMAQAVAASSLPHIQTLSAGTNALLGEPADPIACLLMKERGLDISTHRAKQVNRLMCQQTDLILVTDLRLRHYLEKSYPSILGKVFRIGEFSGTDIPDPYRKPRAMFDESLELIDAGLNAWIERINRMSQRTP